MKRLVVTALSAGLLAACTFTEDYPNSWSNVAEGGGCRGISGVFLNRGDTDPRSHTRNPSLAPLFFSPTDPNYVRMFRADRVEISYDDILTVRVYDGPDLIGTSHQFGNGASVVCDHDSVVASYSGMTGSRSPVFGAENGSFTLRMAKDHSLVVKTSGDFVGLVFMFLPAAGGQTYWWRFRPWQIS